ncbi:MAG: LON peptidase substrate-binding domain-containing protein [bacterium]
MQTGDRLPLFPLDMVLFPHMQLPLYVANESYMRMVDRCIEFDEPFGIVLIRTGSEKDHSVEPYLVGTTARVRKVKQLDDGINILVEGEERFRIRELDDTHQPYLIGTIEPLDENNLPSSPSARKLLKRAQGSFKIYLELLFASHNVPISVHFPTDAAVLSFAMAMALDTDPLHKQHFLELTDTLERFSELIPQIEQRVDEMKMSRTTQLDHESFAEEWYSPN